MHELYSMETIQPKELPLLSSGSRGGIALIVLSVCNFLLFRFIKVPLILT